MMTSSYLPSTATTVLGDPPHSEPINMDQPPKSSGLVHLGMARPKAARRIAKPNATSTLPMSTKTSASNSVSSADAPEPMSQSVESTSATPAPMASPRLPDSAPPRIVLRPLVNLDPQSCHVERRSRWFRRSSRRRTSNRSPRRLLTPSRSRS
ncbi:hypothetical protein L596_007729 [Steinernema carpocapsae]|uniref:Uncharacterized protein n=1 Tax=Steinernema carpocapsae TaxID=34508 RepID=A0A4V6A670_STECR|nr:hypothetical protein L596_007729 [Steinernema carpocapsae]